MTDVRQQEPGCPLLVVRDLCVRYGPGDAPAAVDQVSFELAPGERVSLVGESGSGKTTLGLAIAGFLDPRLAQVSASGVSLGDLDLLGRPRSRPPRSVPGLAMVFQDAMTSLDPVWTVGSQLRAVQRGLAKVSRRQADDAARGWLRRVGMPETDRVMRSRPYELSGGMRQRVMVALALSSRPRLLIADEPTSALDASLARDLIELLVGLTGDMGSALLLISHDIHLCQRYTDKTLVMYGGRIVEMTESAALDTRAAHTYTQALLASVPTLENASLVELPTVADPVGGRQADPAGGCSFRPRCPVAVDACLEQPAERRLGPGHAARCWRAGAPATPDGPDTRTVSEGHAP